jgi:hypothetical protein
MYIHVMMVVCINNIIYILAKIRLTKTYNLHMHMPRFASKYASRWWKVTQQQFYRDLTVRHSAYLQALLLPWTNVAPNDVAFATC